jgi:hypothetical protein
VSLASWDVANIVDAQDELVSMGRYVYAVERESRLGLEAEDCDSLNTVPGVRAAGGVVETSTVITEVDPTMRVSSISATEGYLRIIWPDTVLPRVSSLVVAGFSLRDRLGVVPESYLPVVDSTTRDERRIVFVSQVAHKSLRQPVRDGDLLTVVPPTGSVPVCYVEADFPVHGEIGVVISSWFSNPDSIIIAPMTQATVIGKEPTDRLRSRASAWGPLCGFVVILLVQSLLWLARRSDIALYRLLSLSLSGIIIMTVVDFAAVVFVPAAIGLWLGQIVCLPISSRPVMTMMMLDAGRFFVLLPLIPLLISSRLALIRPLEAIRGR